MTTLQIWQAIRNQGKYGWQFVDIAGKSTLTIQLINTANGRWVYGCSGILKQQLQVIGAEIRDILESECLAQFPIYQGVKLTVDGTVPAPAAPLPPQDPEPPPIVIPPLPPTTPPTDNDRIYYV